MDFSLGNFIIGSGLIALGILVMVKAYYISHYLLPLKWVENRWGPGKDTDAYRLIGLGLCIFGGFTIMGIIDVAGAAFGGTDIQPTNSNQPTPRPQTPSGNSQIFN
jgi:hypothetical protein